MFGDLQNRFRGFTVDLARKTRRLFETQKLESLMKVVQPQNPKATVIFAGLSKNKFQLGGKVTAFEFLPAFCSILRQNGYQTKYTSSMSGLRRAIQNAEYSVVIMVYGEVGFIPDSSCLNELLRSADLVLHHPEIGHIIGDKTAANLFLSQRGVPMPKLHDGVSAKEVVFSNHNNSSGAEVFLVSENSPLDAERYNSSFIDTHVNYAGEGYYTTVRLMCIGEVITHALVRARPVKEGNPRVHGKDTPVNLELVRYLHTELIETNREGLERLAKSVTAAIGPGFYAHDVLIDSKSKDIYLSETGFKLDNNVYYKHISAIIKDLPSLKGFANPAEVAVSSAPIFIKVLEAERERSLGTQPGS